MSVRNTDFKYVSYLWDDAKAAELAGDEVARADVIQRPVGVGAVLVGWRLERALLL